MSSRHNGLEAHGRFEMKFVIASLSRCGSTAVTRVLSSSPAVKIAYEPTFFAQGTSLARIRWRAFQCLRRHDGLKHVWDPNGWPFRNPDHVSSLDALARSDELIAPNRAVLDRADRIVLLRRRNRFDRILSDLWGQQTNLWGHNPDRGHDASEVRRYRAEAKRRAPSPIDPDVFAWYIQNARNWENRIIDCLRPSAARMFFYEDLFQADGADARFSAWSEMFEWLEVEPDFLSPGVQDIVAPESKLNSLDIYERIPNYRELKAHFGEQVAA